MYTEQNVYNKIDNSDVILNSIVEEIQNMQERNKFIKSKLINVEQQKLNYLQLLQLKQKSPDMNVDLGLNNKARLDEFKNLIQNNAAKIEQINQQLAQSKQNETCDILDSKFFKKNQNYVNQCKPGYQQKTPTLNQQKQLPFLKKIEQSVAPVVLECKTKQTINLNPELNQEQQQYLSKYNKFKQNQQLMAKINKIKQLVSDSNITLTQIPDDVFESEKLKVLIQQQLMVDRSQLQDLMFKLKVIDRLVKQRSHIMNLIQKKQ